MINTTAKSNNSGIMELNVVALKQNITEMYSNHVRSSICFSDYKEFHD